MAIRSFDVKIRSWRILLVYNSYRLLCIFLFLSLYLYNFSQRQHSVFFFANLVLYFLASLGFLVLSYRQTLRFSQLVLLMGTVDILSVSIMISIIGDLRFGYGILLNVTIAALSILVPGRLAIYFASLASCLLLCGSLWQFLTTNSKDLAIFYYSGIYGAGFFATALTALYLSHWVRTSERLAQVRSEELASMQKINEYIVERLHAGVIYVTEQHTIKLINSAARSFFNINEQRNLDNLRELSPLLHEKYGEFLSKQGKNKGVVQEIIAEPYLKIYFFATEMAHKPAVLIILEDMTTIAQQAQQLKLAALGRFSASIAHELRNPLGAIAHAVQLLGEDGTLAAEDSRLKQLIINNCERMNGVIKNVLQLSRRQKSQPQFNELASFLEEFKSHFAHNKACDLLIDLPKETISILFDKSQLEQILIILCENALQHGRNAEQRALISISATKQGEKISLIVSDGGPGIPNELRDTIFEPFFTTLRSGTGMGLFLARDLCEMNQARLLLLKTSQGSSFAIVQNTWDELAL